MTLHDILFWILSLINYVISISNALINPDSYDD